MTIKESTKNARFFCGRDEISREKAEVLETLNNTLLDTAIATGNMSLLLGCRFVTIIDRPQSFPLFKS